MHKAKLSWLFILNIFLLITAVISLIKPNLVQSATASHVVISEVRIGMSGGGTQPNNEYIELYNPTASSANISGWKINRKTETADPVTGQTLVATVPASTSIASHGYYLIAHTDYTGTPIEDLTYTSNPIAADNTIYLKNSSDAVIDKLGMGDTNDAEGTAKNDHPADGSLERKANSESDATSMQTGADTLAGNGEDSDNNSADFINRAAGDPQNSASTPETPNASPAPSASPSASAAASASPSVSPSASPSPSAAASASPSPSVSPSTAPSASPAASPSVSPSPSPSSSPSVAPSASPSVSPSPTATPKPRKQLVCKFETRIINFGWFTLTFPNFTCTWKTV